MTDRDTAALAVAIVADPLAAVRAAILALGASRVDAMIMPSGHASIEVTFDTLDGAAAMAAGLGMGQLEHAHNDRNEWWRAERGDYGFERLVIIGGHRPLCQCAATRNGRAA